MAGAVLTMEKEINKASSQPASMEQVALEVASAILLNQVDRAQKQLQNNVVETGKFLKGMGDGEVQFVEETGESLSVAGEYYGQALTGKINLGADVKEFGGAIATGSGQALRTAGDYYFSQVPRGQTNLGNDIGQANAAMSKHWNSLDSEQKGHFFGKELVPLAVPGAIGMVAKEVQGCNLIGKAGEAITALTTSEKLPKLKMPLSLGPELQLAPVYNEGYVPKPFKPVTGHVPGKEVKPTLPGMLAMSRPHGDFGGEPSKSSNTGGEAHKTGAEKGASKAAAKVEIVEPTTELQGKVVTRIASGVTQIREANARKAEALVRKLSFGTGDSPKRSVVDSIDHVGQKEIPVQHIITDYQDGKKMTEEICSHVPDKLVVEEANGTKVTTENRWGTHRKVTVEHPDGTVEILHPFQTLQNPNTVSCKQFQRIGWDPPVEVYSKSYPDGRLKVFAQGMGTCRGIVEDYDVHGGLKKTFTDKLPKEVHEKLSAWISH